MTIASTRSESALVRPFTGIHAADSAMTQVCLSVNGEPHEAGAVVLPGEVLSSAHFTLSLPTTAEVIDAVSATGVPVEKCGLVVIATARSHRTSHILIREELASDKWPAQLDLVRTDADLVFNDLAGFVLTVAVVLLEELPPAPLRPSAAGTWLAQREFKVSPENEEASFSPEPLTDQVREHFGLPVGVLRFIDVDGVLEEDNLSDAVRVYVDGEILNLLLSQPSSPPAIHIQVELAIQATEAVATNIARELGDGSVPAVDLLNSAPAAKRFCENLAQRLSIDLASLLQVATTQTPMLRALLEATFGMREVTSQALKD
ncbi:hypothetical protein [Dietzia kunjamensis]|uniref:hypothetical protein n=1 Tax=Dietzia kunjamensis TaxID=322509 RepID=UPI002096AF5C|nr:hypothetical protein [Dietzia kunjamensis]USX46297.1 hypothetical protein NHB83_01975 [Dietzia kunjamensis]